MRKVVAIRETTSSSSPPAPTDRLRARESIGPGVRRLAGGCLLAFLAAETPAAAGWNAPAVFEVTTTVVNSNQAAWTATIVDGPANNWIPGGAFEPMVFRTKFHAQADSSNELIVGQSDVDGYNAFRDGFYGGATARIYRVVNRAFVKVREDTVRYHYSSGWYLPEGLDATNRLISPAATNAQVNFAEWYRHDADYHFTVRAVDDQGNESAGSDVVTVHWNGWSGAQAAMTNTLVAFTAPANPSETNAPTAPTNLQAAYDTASGLISFTWQGGADPDLAGYRIYYCDRDPASLHGFHIFLETVPADTNLYLRQGDIVFLEMSRTHWDRSDFLGHRVYETTQYGSPPELVPYHNGASQTWDFVAHPQPIPSGLASNGGRTCLRLDVGTSEIVDVGQYNHADLQQSWYGVLNTGKTYVAEVWLRQEALTNNTISFGFGGFYDGLIAETPFSVTGVWQKFTTTFTPPVVFAPSNGVGRMRLRFTGPGTVWIDNFRVYEQGVEFLDFAPAEYAALADSGLSFLRTHSHIKSEWGYTMEDFTNPRGVIGSRGWQTAGSPHTLESLLAVMRNAGINPWLQIEMFMTESEWLGWVEYMAAPYTPGVDTPATKPWAYKRYAQGQAAPWTEVFDRFRFELSNETWNNLFAPWTFMGRSAPDRGTGATFSGGQLYGMWQEYVIHVLRSSPYWTPAVEDKFEFVIGGWDAQHGEDGYGQQAAAFSSNSAHMTVAGYNGGWDEGEPPATTTDETFFKTLAFTPQEAEPGALELAAARDAQAATGAADYVLGTYEAGPGYNLDGLNGVSMTPEQVEAESRVMKSMAGGTATLDAFLARAGHGFDLQNFFTFSRNRNYWTSHARHEEGGQAYPCWMALSLYNRHGTGDHLRVHGVGTPTWDLPATVTRGARDDAPMTAVYATRNGDRYTVFVLSRKLDDFPVAGDDGYTPVTVQLPFTLGPAGAITLYRMTGDPRSNNLDGASVVIEQVNVPTNQFSETFGLNAARGASDAGIEPGSLYAYVFENTVTPALPAAPHVRVEQAYNQDDPAYGNEGNQVLFTAFFDRPVTGFGDAPDDVVIGGSAAPVAYTVHEVTGSRGTAFTITVGPMWNAGVVTASVAAAAAQSAADSADCAASTSTDNEVAILFPEGMTLLEWEFESRTNDFYQNPTSTLWHAFLAPSVIAPGPGVVIGDNRYYNDDAYAATHAHDAAMNTNDYLAWTVSVITNRRLHLWSLELGVFHQSVDAPFDVELRWSTNGFAAHETVPLTPTNPLVGRGLGGGAGTALTADLLAFPGLQGATNAVEFRLYVWNADGEYTGVGIGKLDDESEQDAVDLSLRGMVASSGTLAFATDPLAGSNAFATLAYSATLTNAVTGADPAETLAFWKVGGPGWLNVAANGALGGTPPQTNVGLNSFTVRVVDSRGEFDTATLNITVASPTAYQVWAAGIDWGAMDDAEGADPDGDGLPNKGEHIADTIPTNGDSFFRVTAVSHDLPFAAYFDSSAGRLYTMHSASSLVYSVWTNVPGAGPRMGAGGLDSMQDTNEPPAGSFYRMEVELP